MTCSLILKFLDPWTPEFEAVFTPKPPKFEIFTMNYFCTKEGSSATPDYSDAKINGERQERCKRVQLVGVRPSFAATRATWSACTCLNEMAACTNEQQPIRNPPGGATLVPRPQSQRTRTTNAAPWTVGVTSQETSYCPVHLI